MKVSYVICSVDNFDEFSEMHRDYSFTWEGESAVVQISDELACELPKFTQFAKDIHTGDILLMGPYYFMITGFDGETYTAIRVNPKHID